MIHLIVAEENFSFCVNKNFSAWLLFPDQGEGLSQNSRKKCVVTRNDCQHSGTGPQLNCFLKKKKNWLTPLENKHTDESQQRSTTSQLSEGQQSWTHRSFTTCGCHMQGQTTAQDRWAKNNLRGPRGWSVFVVLRKNWTHFCSKNKSIPAVKLLTPVRLKPLLDIFRTKINSCSTTLQSSSNNSTIVMNQRLD